MVQLAGKRSAGRPREDVNERFWSKVSKGKSCWIWMANRLKTSRWKAHPRSYGRFWHEDKIQYAHRVSYLLTVGKIAKGLCIIHSCDNPRCVNPKHLRPATHQENIADREQKRNT